MKNSNYCEYEKYAEIARFVGCEVALVESSFDNFGRPHTSLASDVLTKHAEIYNQISSFLDKVEVVTKKLRALPSDVSASLELGGGITEAQLENYEDLISRVMERVQSKYSLLDRRGGKNWQAEQVARNMGKLFKEIEIELTFGHYDGHPTTDFGRAVQFAFERLGVDANWREPTRKIAQRTERQNKISQVRI
ncbi:hypothetical protein [uncultured Roseobacter sp.]|uniref:hypothetical protein n=1 Tax=uncultured Roseobacter sp. TaxID=114847 RepID=UPI0026348ECC|nr:hypothetical protein [uncultured Roseobacter sp.]